MFDSTNGPQICRSVFNISPGLRTRHLRNPYTAIEAFISNARDAKVVKIEKKRLLISWKGSVLIMSATAKNKDYCKTYRERNVDEYWKPDRLRKRYALMEFKVKKF